MRFDLETKASPEQVHVVSWTVTESSYGGGGDGFVRISPLGDGGSRVHAEWGNTKRPWVQRPLLFLVYLGPMSRLVSRMWASALNRYALEGGR